MYHRKSQEQSLVHYSSPTTIPLQNAPRSSKASTMKFAHSIALAAATVSLSEALTFNKTAAYAPGQYDKYKCIDTEGVNDMFPQCIRQCQRDVNRNDGCAYDDFACHCANYDVYAPVRVPLQSLGR